MSEDIITYIKDEKNYSKRAHKFFKKILKSDRSLLYIDDNSLIIIPTFKLEEEFLKSNLDTIILQLKFHNKTVLNEILLIYQPNNYKIFDGYSFCELNNCHIYLNENSPKWYEKYRKATESYLFTNKYDFIFKIDLYPDFWFLLKNNQLSLYSFINETLYTDKEEFELYIKSHIPRDVAREYVTIPNGW